MKRLLSFSVAVFCLLATAVSVTGCTSSDPQDAEMNRFIDELTEIRTLIENDDAEGLKEKMKLSTRRRERFDRK